MPILITGSNGFTGKHFKSYLQSIDVEFITLDIDLCDYDLLNSSLSHLNFDHVVHLAGLSSTFNRNFNLYYQVNLIGTLNLLNCLLNRKNLKKILIPSSSLVYSYNPKVNLKENDRLSASNHYSASKLCLENVLNLYHNFLPIVVTRPFNYTGIGQNLNFLVPKICNAYALKKPLIELGNLNIKREFNNIIDIVKIYKDLLFYGINGETYNICTGFSYTVSELLEKLSCISNHRLNVNVNEAFIRHNECPVIVGDNSKLLNVIGEYSFVDIDKTLSDIYNSFI